MKGPWRLWTEVVLPLKTTLKRSLPILQGSLPRSNCGNPCSSILYSGAFVAVHLPENGEKGTTKRRINTKKPKDVCINTKMSQHQKKTRGYISQTKCNEENAFGGKKTQDLVKFLRRHHAGRLARTSAERCDTSVGVNLAGVVGPSFRRAAALVAHRDHGLASACTRVAATAQKGAHRFQIHRSSRCARIGSSIHRFLWRIE